MGSPRYSEIVNYFANWISFSKTSTTVIVYLVICFFTHITASDQMAQVTNSKSYKPSIDESSGLARKGENLWTLNDSGNTATLFKLNINGQLLGSYTISGTENVDWESLAHDEKFIYIADTGNNFNRRNLFTIYRVEWRNIERKNPEVDSITFSYADHVRGKPRSHNFDAEALAIRGDEIWLFTKNRGDLHSNLYRFPKDPGHYDVSPTQALPVDSLVTAADIHPKTGELLLVSTKKTRKGWTSFVWLAPTTINGVDWKNHKSVQIQPNDQWEGVVWDEFGINILLSHENNERDSAGMASLPRSAFEVP